MFMRLLVFILFLLAYSMGCSEKRENISLFTRVNIPPAAKGAPKFDSAELIHQDVFKQKARFNITDQELKTLGPDKLITKAWTALGSGAVDVAIRIAETVLNRFSQKALEQQQLLGGQFPKSGDEEKYKELNAAGTALYIIAEAYEKEGECKKALEYYKRAIEEFPLSQNWDPRGWYWKVKEEAEAKIEKLRKAGCE